MVKKSALSYPAFKRIQHSHRSKWKLQCKWISWPGIRLQVRPELFINSVQVECISNVCVPAFDCKLFNTFNTCKYGHSLAWSFFLTLICANDYLKINLLN